MADIADIAGNNDFTEEVLKRHSGYQSTVKRGKCLSCGEKLEPSQLYCDEYCRAQYEHEQNVKSKTRK